MSDLEIQVARLRRENRFWRALALSAFLALIAATAVWYLNAIAARNAAKRAMTAAAALRDAAQNRTDQSQ